MTVALVLNRGNRTARVLWDSAYLLSDLRTEVLGPGVKGKVKLQVRRRYVWVLFLSEF